MGRRRSWSDAANGSSRSGGSDQAVDPLSHREIGLGEASGRVVGQRQPDLVPAVDEDVRVMIGLLGRVGHAVDELHGLGEILKLPLADDLVALATPFTVL